MIDDVDSDDGMSRSLSATRRSGIRVVIEDVTRSPMSNAFKRRTTYE